MAKIFDREDEPNDFMEMPCRCDCGKWFDLNDGYPSERDRSKTICGECGEREEQEIKKEEEISEQQEIYDNAKYDMELAAQELKKLGIAMGQEKPDPFPELLSRIATLFSEGKGTEEIVQVLREEWVITKKS